MLACMHVEHEVDQRALQPRSHAHVDRKPSARDLGRALQVEYAERRAQVPMRLRFKIKCWFGAPFTDLDIFFSSAASRRRFVGHVWNAREQLMKSGFQLLRGHIKGADPIPD